MGGEGFSGMVIVEAPDAYDQGYVGGMRVRVVMRWL